MLKPIEERILDHLAFVYGAARAAPIAARLTRRQHATLCAITFAQRQLDLVRRRKPDLDRRRACLDQRRSQLHFDVLLIREVEASIAAGIVRIAG